MSAAIVREVGELARIFENDVNVGVLERSLPPVIATYAGLLAADRGWSFTDTVDARGASSRIAEALPGGPGRDELAADVAFWMEVLAELTGVAHVGVRLARLETPMCPALHVDKVTVRVVSAYVGAGTEWMDEGVLRRCREGDVLLLKGERWPGNEGRGAVHRSPPNAAAEHRTRVLLTLDPLA